MRALEYDIGDVHEVDVRNDGTLAGLQDDDVVEVPARVDAGRIAPLAQRRSPRSCSASSSTSPPTSG